MAAPKPKPKPPAKATKRAPQSPWPGPTQPSFGAVGYGAGGVPPKGVGSAKKKPGAKPKR